MNNQNVKRPKVAILFGGRSPEYGVSLKSAYSVITHIDDTKYEPILIGINRRGEWFQFVGEPEKIINDAWNNPFDCVRAIISPSREIQGLVIFEKDGDINSIKIDAAMPVLHGKNGEDGTLQGLLELAGIPIVGCKTLASALCMDKDRAHKVANAAGVLIPRSFIVKRNTEASEWLAQAKSLNYPLFVKPVKAG
jgi:D-alanine---D-serine ligase